MYVLLDIEVIAGSI